MDFLYITLISLFLDRNSSALCPKDLKERLEYKLYEEKGKKKKRMKFFKILFCKQQVLQR